MTKHKQHLKKVLAALCVILILAYAFIVFLPHSHDSFDADCNVCSIIEFSKKALVALAVCVAAWQILWLEYVIPNISRDALFAREKTPVGLKVKLSD